jgi:hypothetical protein
MAIGIKSLGMEDYFTRLYNKLGIELTANVKHYLFMKGRNRNKRLNKAKTKEQKRLVKKRHFLDLKKNEALAKHERTKRDGTYKSGQNMDLEGDDDETAPPRKKKSRNAAICPSCGLKGHMTRRSKACLHYKGKVVTAAVTTATTATTLQCTELDPAEDMLNFDSLPIDGGPPEDSDDEVRTLLVRYDPAMCDSDGEDLYNAAAI